MVVADRVYEQRQAGVLDADRVYPVFVDVAVEAKYVPEHCGPAGLVGVFNAYVVGGFGVEDAPVLQHFALDLLLFVVQRRAQSAFESGVFGEWRVYADQVDAFGVQGFEEGQVVADEDCAV